MPSGYGVCWLGEKKFLSHRAAYTLTYGPIAEGMMVDHLCHNKSCARPDHLRLTTVKENGEHRAGAQTNSTSGIRGVRWRAEHKRWIATVTHNGRQYHVGSFTGRDEAEAAAIAKRNELFTHNDLDRKAA